MISVESQKLIEDLIVKSGAVTADQLGQLKMQALQQKKPLLSFIQEKNLLEEEQLTKILAQAVLMPYVNLKGLTVSPEILGLMKRELSQRYMAVPFGMTKGKLAVAMLDAGNVQATDFITRQTGHPLSIFMASRSSIESVLAQYGSPSEVTTGNTFTQAPENPAIETKPESPQVQENPKPAAPQTSLASTVEIAAKAVEESIQNAPITQALNSILEYAVKSRASDIHIEPREKELKVRCRIDGILKETLTLSKTLEPALVSRVKILSNLKIDEHRIPQDGQFRFQSGGRDIDARVAVAPVVNGEQVVIRLLDAGGFNITLESLGILGNSFELVKKGIKRPYGMTLCTGPTGSGKSTTLYAIIKEINDNSINIVTLEDPVEYRMDNINQIQINPRVGLTFASGLRSVLRQDPNVVMVGEIRDKVTADLAVQAALTGHIVLSSLHTNSAAGVLPRMLDMNIEPFLLASTINTVIGQRLVRKLCDKCREEYKSNEAQKVSINKVISKILPQDQSQVGAKAKALGYPTLPLASQSAYTLYKAKGCSECTSGFKGRMGIFEVFSMNETIEQLLVKRATAGDIQRQAVEDGMLTMKQDGYLKALAGMTTLEEVARVAADQ